MEHNFFPQRPAVTPTIYAYRLPGVESHKGYLKIGYTNRTAQERIEEQLHTSKIKYEIVLVKSAMANDGSCFTDKDIHKILESKGCHRLNPLDKTDEWFKCSVKLLYYPFVQGQTMLRTEHRISRCVLNSFVP